MNLDNFDQQTSLIINTAFNYASENGYAYFTPINILEVLVNVDKKIKSTLKNFSINPKDLYLEAQKYLENQKKEIVTMKPWYKVL